MLINCPGCLKNIEFSSAQQAKIKKALEKLSPGKKLTVKCPYCGGRAKVSTPATGETTVTTREMARQVEKHVAAKKEAAVVPKPAGDKQETVLDGVAPPPPPAVEWLKEGEDVLDEKSDDMPRALVLCSGSSCRKDVADALGSLGYKVISAGSYEEAREKMVLVDFACVVLHENFEDCSLAESRMHSYMKRMDMAKRRYLFYVVIGSSVKSLWDIEALAESANLVVAEKDLPLFDILLRRSIPVYEELFGPFLGELSAVE